VTGPRLDRNTELSAAEARRILERRAKALAQPLEEDAAPGRTRELLVFSCAGEACAVAAPNVVEVVPLVDPTPVPGTPPAVLGVVNHRGRILAVVDVGRLLAPAEHAISRAGVLVVVTAGEASFAVRADSVPELVAVKEEEVRSAPRLGEQQDSIVHGVTGNMVAVIDVEALARDPRIAVDDQVE
jgi:purine-binding chemotaxis protein CheW